MGAIGGMFGAGGGASGSGFKSPQGATVLQAATPDQIAAAQAGSVNSMGDQQRLLAALQANNGAATNGQSLATQQGQGLVGQLAANNGAANQGSVYNQTANLGNALAANRGVEGQNAAATSGIMLGNGMQTQNVLGQQNTGLAQQNALNSGLAGANGVGTQTGAIQQLQGIAAQQGTTAQQYQNIANGNGPNPAQAALNNATGQNVANQAALMAGQRGAGSNVGLIARQAAQQGAGIQQQAAGQSAQMQANQQLAGLSGLSAQQQAQAGTNQAIGGLGTTQVGQQQAGIGQGLSQANQMVGQQQAQQGINAGIAQQQIGNQQANNAQQAGIAATQVGQQMGAQGQNAGQQNILAGQQIGQTNQDVTSLQNQQAMLSNAIGQQNASNVGLQSNINTANAGLAQGQAGGQKDAIGGAFSSIAGAAGSLFAQGGQVKRMANGGDATNSVTSTPPTPAIGVPAAPKAPPQYQGTSMFGRFLSQMGSNLPGDQVDPTTGQPSKLNKGSSDLFGTAAKAGAKWYAQSGEPEVADAEQTATEAADSAGSEASDYGQAQAYRWDQATSGEAPFGSDPSVGGIGSGADAGEGASEATDAEQVGQEAVEMVAARGGKVKAKDPKEKAVKRGNSYSNDKVPAMLSEGEIVIPRSVAMSKDPVRGAADFVAKVLAKKKAGTR